MPHGRAVFSPEQNSSSPHGRPHGRGRPSRNTSTTRKSGSCVKELSRSHKKSAVSARKRTHGRTDIRGDSLPACLFRRQPSAPSSLKLRVPPDGLFPPLPRTVRVEQSSITARLCRCPAGEGRGEGGLVLTAVRHSLPFAGPRVSTFAPSPCPLPPEIEGGVRSDTRSEHEAFRGRGIES